jgi:hypothetical protein
MKQGTIKTLGAIALGTVAIIAGGGSASAASNAPTPGGGSGVASPQQLPGQGAAKPSAPKAAAPDQSSLLGRIPGLNGLPTSNLMHLG